MSVRKGNKSDSWFLVQRMVQRIMATGFNLGDSYLMERVAYERIRHMPDAVLQRYAADLMSERADSDEMKGFHLNVCHHCRACERDEDLHFDDHQMSPTLRSVMIYVVCRAILDEILQKRWDTVAA